MTNRGIRLGGGGGDPHPHLPLKNCTITLHGDRMVNAINIQYNNGHQMFLGKGGGNVSGPLTLNGNDHITEIEVRTGDMVDFISMKDNKGNRIQAGGGGGVHRKSGGRVDFISISSGDAVDAIWIH